MQFPMGHCLISNLLAFIHFPAGTATPKLLPKVNHEEEHIRSFAIFIAVSFSISLTGEASQFGVSGLFFRFIIRSPISEM